MKKTSFASLLVLLALIGPLGCRQSSSDRGSPHDENTPPSTSTSDVNKQLIAVSNSYLATAVYDLLDDDKSLFMLAEPGMCPGHFDLRPSQVSQLRACRLLVRFDFQQSLDERISDIGKERPQVIVVTLQGGLGEPDSYRSACRQTAEGLVQHGRLAPAEADRRLAKIEQRMEQLDRWAKEQIDKVSLQGKPVLASGHQADFCRWLGLNVVETFSSADTARPSIINKAINAGEKAGVKLIVANRPEGRKLADALADRLGAKVVVFANFPEGIKPEEFDRMVRHNIACLVEAVE